MCAACGCVGGGDMVDGCGCEGGQNENSDYIYAEYSLLIISECVSGYCLFYSAFLYPILFYLIMFMISVLSVCCCALLNFESFIHGHFLSFFFFCF